MGWDCAVLCYSEDSVVCVAGGIGACSNGELRCAVEFRERMFAVALPVWCCSWLPMECCGLAKEEWEDSGDAVGSCASCCYPGDVLFVQLFDQALFGGDGGGAPERGIGAARVTGSS